ncbi:MAG: PH domain-containing protein [Bryobacteraceae bacterium]
MPDAPTTLKLRSSSKAIKAGYACALLLALAIAAYILSSEAADARLWALLTIPAALALYLVIQHLAKTYTQLTIESGRLRYESGMLSKSTRTMDLAKLQDVRVDQSASQRLMGIGDLSIESAGNTSQIVMLSIDRPQEAADRILEIARGH